MVGATEARRQAWAVGEVTGTPTCSAEAAPEDSSSSEVVERRGILLRRRERSSDQSSGAVELAPPWRAHSQSAARAQPPLWVNTPPTCLE